MDEYLSEKEQIAEIRKWWDDNGSYVIAGLVLGVAILVGWNTWKSSKQTAAESASRIYGEVMLAVNEQDRERALALTEELRADYAKTPYLDQALFGLAKLYVDLGEHEEAVTRLEELVNTTSDEQLRKVGRARLARVLLELGQGDKALTVLADQPGARFSGLYHEIRGDAYAMVGNVSQAAEEYRNALDAIQPGLGDRNLIEMKMADLPVSDPPLDPPLDSEPAEEDQS